MKKFLIILEKINHMIIKMIIINLIILIGVKIIDSNNKFKVYAIMNLKCLYCNKFKI